MAATDTIVAIATASGRGAVGIVRVSGPDVPRIAAALLGSVPTPRVATYGPFRAADDSSLDAGLALYFAAPASFTGEHVLELQGHGGAVVLNLLVQRLCSLGCRVANPGEFSERAFWNGKIDVAQAEAVADLIDASSSAAARAAMRSLQGEFSQRIAYLQSELTELRVHTEATLDFPDEDLDSLSDRVLETRLEGVFNAFDKLLAAAEQGALLRDGLTVVIAGKPNAGKSSLLNRLVGDEVAIVTESPGTTRDVLRHELQLDGLPLKLLDTAGLRTAADPIEAEGIRRATRELDRADRVLYVIDAGDADAAAPQQVAQQLAALPQGLPVTLVFNKIDLCDVAPHVEASEPPRVYLSARTGAGLALLRTHLKASVGYQSGAGEALAARGRHLDALRRARVHVEQAAAQLAAQRGTELFAEELRCAQQALGEITGEFSSDDLLGQIFASFCIGK